MPGGWFVNRGAEQLVIRGVGFVRSGEDGLRDIANVTLKDEDGFVVRVRDVGTVRFGGEIRQGAVSMTIRDSNGNAKDLGEVVQGIVLKRMGANTKATIDGIKERLPIIETALPEGVILDPFYDQADLIDRAVSTVSTALIEAFVLIIVVLALFLMNVRSVVLVLVSVPISIGLALMVMSYWGLSANLMSLGGLAIAIGMMVNGSVVMMENIFRHLTEASRRSKDEGIETQPQQHHGLRIRIQEAAREVGRPVFFGVVIIIVVFAPLFCLEGVEGKLFQPMATSIVLAMIASLFVALIVVPAMATYLFAFDIKYRESPILKPIQRLYEQSLTKALGARQRVVLIAPGLVYSIASTSSFSRYGIRPGT